MSLGPRAREHISLATAYIAPSRVDAFADYLNPTSVFSEEEWAVIVPEIESAICDGTPVVYVLRQVGAGFLKVGTTTNLRSRINSYETGSPHELEVLLTLPGSVLLETSVHRLLRDHRKRREWFYESLEAIHILQRIKNVVQAEYPPPREPYDLSRDDELLEALHRLNASKPGLHPEVSPYLSEIEAALITLRNDGSHEHFLRFLAASATILSRKRLEGPDK